MLGTCAASAFGAVETLVSSTKFSTVVLFGGDSLLVHGDISVSVSLLDHISYQISQIWSLMLLLVLLGCLCVVASLCFCATRLEAGPLLQ